MARYNLGPCSDCCDAIDRLCDEVECPSGHVCIGGRCFRVCGFGGPSPIELTSCESDAGCPDGCVCINGVCLDEEDVFGLGSCCEVLSPGSPGNDRNCFIRRPYVPSGAETCIMPEASCVDRQDIGISRNWAALNLRSCKQCPATREGACCLPDGTCEVLCETECEAIDGAVYKGDVWLDCDTSRFPGNTGGACDPDQINCRDCCYSFSADFTNPPTCPNGWTLELGDEDGDGVPDAPSYCTKCEEMAVGADDQCVANADDDAVLEMVNHVNGHPNKVQVVDGDDILATGGTYLPTVHFECDDGNCYEGVDEQADCPDNPLP